MNLSLKSALAETKNPLKRVAICVGAVVLLLAVMPCVTLWTFLESLSEES